MRYVWIHVHGGTMISAFGFATEKAADAFRAEYGADERLNMPRLPGTSWHDDLESDTWILLENPSGGLLTVDGDAVTLAEPA